jgi:hypothetical protein
MTPGSLVVANRWDTMYRSPGAFSRMKHGRIFLTLSVRCTSKWAVSPSWSGHGRMSAWVTSRTTASERRRTLEALSR